MSQTVPPPTRLTILEAVAYVEKKHKFKITTKTVYNWTERGLRKETLNSKLITNPNKSHKHRKIKVTTTKWVDEFLKRTGVVDAK